MKVEWKLLADETPPEAGDYWTFTGHCVEVLEWQPRLQLPGRFYAPNWGTVDDATHWAKFVTPDPPEVIK